MSSHVLLPQLDDVPATFSARILQEVLRREIGFDGVIVSDALDMAGASGELGIAGAAVRAIAGGCDLLCIGTRNTDAQLGELQAALEAAAADGTLAADRLADAAARNRALASGLAAPAAVDSAAEPEFDLDRAIAAFDVRDGVNPAPGAPILALETTANIAIGSAPWGPVAAGAEAVTVREGETLPALTAAPVLVGKDNHRRGWTRDLIDAARAQHPGAVVVDMGWPSPDRAYADVATFGASRFAGRALLRWLEGAS
jgi:beta-N-acetylhexosaminidase